MARAKHFTMEDNPKDFHSPSGNRLVAGNPPASSEVVPAAVATACGAALEEVAGARILEAPTPCLVMAALVGDLGCRGSKLPDPGCKEGGSDVDSDIDDTSSTGTITGSLESVLLREEGESVGNNSTTNPLHPEGLDVDNPDDTSIGALSDSLGSVLRLGEGESAGTVSTANPLPPISLPETGGLGKLSKTRRTRIRRAKARARALETGASGTGPVPPGDGATKRVRSVGDSSNTDQSFGAQASASAAASTGRKRRKVAAQALSSSASVDQGAGAADKAVAGPSGLQKSSSTTEGQGCATAVTAAAAPSGSQESPTATVGEGKSFSEVAAAALTVAVRTNSGEGGLSEEQTSFLEDHIWDQLGEAKESPRFEGVFVRDGALMVRCADERSLEWLLHMVSRIPARKGVKFVATKTSDLLRLTRATCWIPGKQRKISEVLVRLSIQNPGLDTKSWRVYAYNFKGRSPEQSEGSTLAVGMDENSVKVLETVCGLRPHLFIGRVKFNLSR